MARVKRKRSREAHERRDAKRPPTLPPILGGPLLRKGSYFNHPAGRMVILHVGRDRVSFTYPNDEGQYVRVVDRDAFDVTYGRTR